MQTMPTSEELKDRLRRLEAEVVEARRQKEILGRKEEKLSLVSETTPMAMMLYQNARWLYINRAAEILFGYPLQELFDMHFLDLVHPDFRGIVHHQENHPPVDAQRLEFKIRTKDGQDRWVSGAETLAMLGGMPAGIISVIDITELKLTEEKLRASEEKYRLLLETATDIIFTMDEHLRMTYVSPAVTRLRGLTVEEAMAQTPAEILTPASYELAMRAFAEEMMIEEQVSKDKNRIRVLELEEYCKDGSTIWTESIFNAIRNTEGRFIGMLGITRDISERKRAEQERERLMKDRQKAMAELKILSGMLPICSACKKIRDDQGYWNQIEAYIRSHSEADFSHGLCPDCIQKLYPDRNRLHELS